MLITLLPLVLGIMLAQTSPGPNMMAVAASSLGSGRTAGLLTVAGIATGAMLWSLLFAFGAGALLQAFPQLVTAMKLVGGSYLAYLAFRSVRAILTARHGNLRVTAARRTGLTAYVTGLAVVLTNPKAALMWVAIALYLASSGISSAGFIATGVFTACSALAIYGSYAILFSTGLALRAYGRFSRWIEGLFGLVFGALGVRLLAEGVAELRG